jgi:hypothetical protein
LRQSRERKENILFSAKDFISSLPQSLTRQHQQGSVKIKHSKEKAFKMVAKSQVRQREGPNRRGVMPSPVKHLGRRSESKEEVGDKKNWSNFNETRAITNPLNRTFPASALQKTKKTLVVTPSKFAIIVKTPKAPNKRRNASSVSRSSGKPQLSRPQLSPRKTRNLSKLFKNNQESVCLRTQKEKTPEVSGEAKQT